MNDPGASSRKRIVIVAGGHDSSGRAGVEVDRRALEHLDLEIRVVVTAWTQQDESGVRELGAVDAQEWSTQLRECLDDQVGAIKFGMLPGASAVRAARELATSLPAELPVVLDPVIAASSGARFLSPDEVVLAREQLAPLDWIWTPNLPELAEIVGGSAGDLDRDEKARIEAAEALLDEGPRAVIVKGGHTSGGEVRDLLLERDSELRWISRPRVQGPSLRGTGCRFASALAGCLSLGKSLPEAARQAGDWVAACIANRA